MKLVYNMNISGNNTLYTDRLFVGIGTSTVEADDFHKWERVLQIRHPQNCKIITTCDNNNVILGSYAHGTFGNSTGSGSIGTESNHPLRILTNYRERIRITETLSLIHI